MGWGQHLMVVVPVNGDEITSLLPVKVDYGDELP